MARQWMLAMALVLMATLAAADDVEYYNWGKMISFPTNGLPVMAVRAVDVNRASSFTVIDYSRRGRRTDDLWQGTCSTSTCSFRNLLSRGDSTSTFQLYIDTGAGVYPVPTMVQTERCPFIFAEDIPCLTESHWQQPDVPFPLTICLAPVLVAVLVWLASRTLVHKITSSSYARTAPLALAVLSFSLVVYVVVTSGQGSSAAMRGVLSRSLQHDNSVRAAHSITTGLKTRIPPSIGTTLTTLQQRRQLANATVDFISTTLAQSSAAAESIQAQSLSTLSAAGLVTVSQPDPFELVTDGIRDGSVSIDTMTDVYGGALQLQQLTALQAAQVAKLLDVAQNMLNVTVALPVVPTTVVSTVPEADAFEPLVVGNCLGNTTFCAACTFSNCTLPIANRTSPCSFEYDDGDRTVTATLGSVANVTVATRSDVVFDVRDVFCALGLLGVYDTCLDTYGGCFHPLAPALNVTGVAAYQVWANSTSFVLDTRDLTYDWLDPMDRPYIVYASSEDSVRTWLGQ